MKDFMRCSYKFTFFLWILIREFGRYFIPKDSASLHIMVVISFGTYSRTASSLVISA